MEWGVIIMGLKIGCSCESILYCIGWMDINWCIYGRLRSFLFIVSRRKATLILQLQFMWCREGDVNSDVRLMPAIEKRTFTNSFVFFSLRTYTSYIYYTFFISPVWMMLTSLIEHSFLMGFYYGYSALLRWIN